VALACNGDSNGADHYSFREQMEKNVISYSINKKVKRGNNIKMNNVKNLADAIYFTIFLLVTYSVRILFTERT